MGPGKDFQEKKRFPRSDGSNSETKRDIVMGPTDKMVVTKGATNTPLTKNGLPMQTAFWVDTHFGGRQVPNISEQGAENVKVSRQILIF